MLFLHQPVRLCGIAYSACPRGLLGVDSCEETTPNGLPFLRREVAVITPFILRSTQVSISARLRARGRVNAYLEAISLGTQSQPVGCVGDSPTKNKKDTTCK